MPDERDPQNAAPSADGDPRNDHQAGAATATATAEPPEEKEAAGAQAEAQASAGDEGAQADERIGEGKGNEEREDEPAATAEASAQDDETEAASDDEAAEPQTGAGDDVEPKPEGGEEQGAEERTEDESSEAEPVQAAAEEPQAATVEEPQGAAAEEPQGAAAEEPQAAAEEPPAEEPQPAAEAASEPETAAAEVPQAAAEEPSPQAAAEDPQAAAAESSAVEPSQPAAETAAQPETAAAEAPTAPPLAEPLTSAPATAEAASEGDEAPAEPTAEPAAEAEAEQEPAAAAAEAAAGTEAAAEPAADAETMAAASGETGGPAAEPAAEPKAEAAEAAAQAEEKEPALDDPALLALREAKETGGTVTGKVIGWNRGGFHVVIDEVTAFCPASEMELGRPRSPETYMDRELDFKVAKFQRRGRRVVLSRSDLLKAKRDEVLAGLKPGTVVSGTVTSLPEFGAFIDLGGIEGLVHVSEISRSRVTQPKDALQLGQQVEVKVLKIEKGGDRISLSMKELEPDPWQGVANRYPRGSKFTGKVLRHADFGMFVELEPDVEGLVHVSQLPPGSNLESAALKPGSEIEGWVREVDTKRQRIALSLREVPESDPWREVGKRYPEGELVEGTVESIAPFGVFINLAPGLTGLLPNSQTGLPRGTNAARAFRPGQTVTVQVLTVDARRKRISLGKQGSRVEATKADVQDFRKQQREQETKSAGAMEAAFARLGLGADEDEAG